MPDLAPAPATAARHPRHPTAREFEALAYLTAATDLVTADDLGRDLAYGGEPRALRDYRARPDRNGAGHGQAYRAQGGLFR